MHFGAPVSAFPLSSACAPKCMTPRKATSTIAVQAASARDDNLILMAVAPGKN
jgi:hypothetical protein